MKMEKERKIGCLALAKFQALMGVLIGLFLGILYSFGGLLLDIMVTLDLMQSSETPGLSYGSFLAFGALIGMPIIFATAGFFLGLIEAFLYHAFRKWFVRFNLSIKFIDHNKA